MNESVEIYKNETRNMISFSESAVKHLISYLQKNLQYKGVRLGVKKTGCSGLSYVIDYVTTFNEEDLPVALTHGYRAFVDKASLPFLQNMTVDYVKQGLNNKFIFTNPNQTGQCGCGESFTIG